MIDEVNESPEFRTNIFIERCLTFKTYLLVLAALQPATMIEFFAKAVASDSLAGLRTDHGRDMFTFLFWDIRVKRWPKSQRTEFHSSLSEWMKKYPDQGASILLKQMLSALAK
jgi:hypothetical protein